MPNFYRKHQKIISVLLVAVFVVGGVVSFMGDKEVFAATQPDTARPNNTATPSWYTDLFNGITAAGYDVTTHLFPQSAPSVPLAQIVTKSNGQTKLDVTSSGSGVAGQLEQILGSMLAWILYFIAVGLGWIMILVTKVMLTIAVFNSFLSQPAVQIGWTITRDICNNFFIIFMMILALGTTLHIQTYAWRTQLPKILIFAVLINFSMMFTGILIDVSQVLMLTFASPLSTAHGYGLILNAFGLPNLYNFQPSISQETPGADLMNIVAALIFAIIVTIVSIVVITCIAVILVYRIIMLMFLVILSPLFFLSKASNVKALDSIAGEWMGNLSKMLTVGPAMMFFLYLSFLTMAAFSPTTNTSILTDKNMQAQIGGASADQGYAAMKTPNTSDQNLVDISKMASLQGVINFLVVVGMLWASLMMGKRFGDAAGGVAGAGQKWLSGAAKKYSGFNLGKRAAKGAPGAIGTAIDDKLGVRQKLYSGIYKAGGKYVPFAREALGGRIGALESAKAKRMNATVQGVGRAANVDNLDENQLRNLAQHGKKYERIAATQTMMKKGLLKDDELDEAKKRNNVELIKQARTTLAGTDLGKEFDDNLRKFNTNTALNTIYDKDGKLDREKLESDLKTGKIDITKVMGSLDKETLAKMQGAFGGGDGVAKFMMQFGGGDLAKIDKAMSSEIKKQVWSGVDNESFAKRDSAGNIVKENGKIVYDADRRKEYLSVKNDVMKAFDVNDADDKEKARKYFSENRGKVLENMAVEGMDQNFLQHLGDLVTAKELEKFSDRSSEAKEKLQGSLDTAIQGVNFDSLRSNISSAVDAASKAAAEKEMAKAEDMLRKNLAVQGNLSGAAMAKVNAGEGQIALGRVLGGMKVEDAEKLKWGKMDPALQAQISAGLDPNTLRAISTRGNNNELVKGVKDSVKDAAKIDNESEKEFTNAKNKYTSAKKKLDDTLDQIDQLTDEEDIARNAGDAVEAAKISQRIIKLREQIATVLSTQEFTAKAGYDAMSAKHAGKIKDENWIKQDVQKREQAVRGKKKKGEQIEDEDED